MTRQEINEIVNMVVARLQSVAASEDTDVVAVFPGYTPYYNEIIEYIKKHNPRAVFMSTDASLEEKAGIHCCDEQTIVDNIIGAKRIYICGVRTAFLKRIANVDDDNFLESATVTSLMQNKEVVFMMNYSVPGHKAKSSSFYAKVAEVCATLENAGASLIAVGATYDMTPHDFISEEMVKIAHEKDIPTLYYSKNAIITPAAKDKASELSIVLKESEQ